MTEIQFAVDEETITADLAVDPLHAEPAALEETYFVMPVRMRVRDTELFLSSRTSEPWLSLPILGFATHLSEALQRLGMNAHDAMFLSGGGQLTFDASADNVIVTCTLTQQSESVGKKELNDAANSFNESVRSFLLKRVQGIDGHPFWAKWFKT